MTTPTTTPTTTTTPPTTTTPVQGSYNLVCVDKTVFVIRYLEQCLGIHIFW